MTEPGPLDLLNNQERQMLREAVTEFNDDLLTRNINIAGQAFGNALLLGSAVMAVPVTLILVLSYFFSRVSLASVFVYVGSGFFLAMLFAAVIANRAKEIYMHDADTSYLTEKIEGYLRRTSFTWEQLNATAEQVFTENAPIRVYLQKKEK